MFTGIVLAIGTIVDIVQQQGDSRFKISVGKLPIEQVKPGDSIAVNGVCLTATAIGDNYFCADVSRETLSHTGLQVAEVGTSVNLELALTPSTRMGGHIVSGHIDGVGIIIDKRADARCYRFIINVPDQLQKYIAPKGSICVEGISLTINAVNDTQFGINIVPHTMQSTTFGRLEVGNQVNLEVDILARYMESLMQDKRQHNQSTITETRLQQSGFLKD